MKAEEAINILEPIRMSTVETSTGGFEPRPIAKALQLAVNALKKEIPMKPKEKDLSSPIYGGSVEGRDLRVVDVDYATSFICPNCGNEMFRDFGIGDDWPPCEEYCQWCGQRIDWSEEKT